MVTSSSNDSVLYFVYKDNRTKGSNTYNEGITSIEIIYEEDKWNKKEIYKPNNEYGRIREIHKAQTLA